MSESQQNKLIEVSTLGFSYAAHQAFKDVNFCLNAGEYVCLVGTNGSGKTTLLKTLSGLLKPSEGTIQREITAGEIAYLSQTAHGNEDFPASVREFILSGRQGLRKNSFFYTQEDKDALARVLKALEIEDIARKKIGELSGGQLRRVEIACALIREPKLFILDEPFAGLDPEISSVLHHLLAKMNKQGTCILISSHDVQFVRKHATRVLEMEGGIIYDGSPLTWHGLREKADPCDTHEHEHHDHRAQGLPHEDCCYCEHLVHHNKPEANCAHCAPVASAEAPLSAQEEVCD